MKGKSYNRAVRAHKLVMEALFRIMWQVFLDWLRKSRREIEKDKVAEKRDFCKRALESRKRVPESVEELKSEMKELLAIFKTSVASLIFLPSGTNTLPWCCCFSNS